MLSQKSESRLQNMKSEGHQKAFLAIRCLLKLEQYSDIDLIYDAFGKPFLANKLHISISHSHHFATIAISNQKIGIDIELQREKIIKIADKFSQEVLKPSDKSIYIRKLTQIWCAKEALFKIKNQAGISFKNHIFVKNLKVNATKNTSELHFNNQIEYFQNYLYLIEDFILVATFEKSFIK